MSNRYSQGKKVCLLAWWNEDSLNNKIKKVLHKFQISEKDFEIIKKKSKISGEFNEDSFEDWFENRFATNLIILTKKEYTQMCVNALRILPDVAKTDFGMSRQRDMGQIWADITRGYLGELAFLKFLQKHWAIKAELGHKKGSIKKYLPMDIHKVCMLGEKPREPKIKISVKTTKWNGIWLDIPGDQFSHSNVYILVKIGIETDHLFSFFKEISVFKDKVLKAGEDVGSLSKAESKRIYDDVPPFKEVTAYICGFALERAKYSVLPYSGKKGTKNYNITGWKGPISTGDLEKIKKREKIAGNVKFEGIGNFSHDSGFLFSTGNLLWSRKDWDKVISKL